MITFFSNNPPEKIENPLSGLIHPPEKTNNLLSLTFIHEFSETLELYLLSRISENPAQRIVEIQEVPINIHFVDTFFNILDKGLIALAG